MNQLDPFSLYELVKVCRVGPSGTLDLKEIENEGSSVSLQQQYSEPVYLNVYDLIDPENPERFTAMNAYLRKIGVGFYHSGVEVYGVEFCFGGSESCDTGVFHVEPRRAQGASYRQSIYMGNTPLSPNEVFLVVQILADSFRGNTFSLLRRNCNHFSDLLCLYLTGKRAPKWINRLCSIGMKVKWLLPKSLDNPSASPLPADKTSLMIPVAGNVNHILNQRRNKLQKETFEKNKTSCDP
ncbi:DeSI-like protein At4g17486 [Galdieria sulphuraria]|nr:DeSI-like protein At4g17486 [Galdieria sulphuraria]